MTKLTPNSKFFAEFQVQNDGALKIKMAKKYITVNQHKNYWVDTNARDLARAISKATLVTK